MYYKLDMKLNEQQLNEIKKACEDIDFGTVTIKLNKTLKFVDIVLEKQVRLQNEPTVNNAPQQDKRY